ncbi:hypothetical protein DICVIV_00825 [Dictyocaulus viviparus]|uniref:Uncharacterized protein n=1 Tax=Dictyocaulus viviparus TaxID=29172 RepID=A0A0D8YEA4_DICVI|nr:hypothetical protein DICVIV_00825 [Dictyocaulus viviparus]
MLGASSTPALSNFNPFAAEALSQQGVKQSNDDLLDLFNAPTQVAYRPIRSGLYQALETFLLVNANRRGTPLFDRLTMPSTQHHIDATNPFAQYTAPNNSSQAPTNVYPSVGAVVGQSVPSSTGVSEVNSNGFQADFVGAFAARKVGDTNGDIGKSDHNPFLTDIQGTSPPTSMWNSNFNSVSVSSGAPGTEECQCAFHVTEAAPQQTNPTRFSSTNSSTNNSPVPFQIQQQQMPHNVLSSAANTDGSYSDQSHFSVNMVQQANTVQSSEQSPPHESVPSHQQGSFDPFTSQQGQGQPKIGGDIDSALSSLADNLSISGNSQTYFRRPVQWGGPQQHGQPQVSMPLPVTVPPVAHPQLQSYGAQPQYTTPFGQYTPQAYGGHMPQWQMQPPRVYSTPQHSQAAPSNFPIYGGTGMGYGQTNQPHPQPGQDPFGF